MFTKAILGLAVILATASGALAAPQSNSVAPSRSAAYSVYNPSGTYVGRDPDLGIRFELNRDWAHGKY